MDADEGVRETSPLGRDSVEFTWTAFPFHLNTLQSFQLLPRCASWALIPLLDLASLTLLSWCLTMAIL